MLEELRTQIVIDDTLTTIVLDEEVGTLLDQQFGGIQLTVH